MDSCKCTWQREDVAKIPQDAPIGYDIVRKLEGGPMKKLLLLVLLSAQATPAVVPQLLQAPSAISQTGVVSVTLNNQIAGDDNLVAVSFCENACALDPGNDKVRVSDTLGNYCEFQGSVTNANQQLSLWRCSHIKAAASNTVRAYIFLGPNEPAGATINSSMSASEWSPLGARILVPQPGDFTFSVAIGANGGPSTNALVVNPWNGFIVSQAGPAPLVWTCPTPMASMTVGFRP
jgi:hypothetical protein